MVVGRSVDVRVVAKSLGRLFLVVVALSAGQAPAASPYPQVEFVRVLPSGEEAYALHCQKDPTGSDRYVCRLSRRYNGQNIDTKWVYARQVNPFLHRFLKELPKQLPEPAEHDVALRWEVSVGGKSLGGAVARMGGAARADAGANPVREALLALEVDLASPFFE